MSSTNDTYQHLFVQVQPKSILKKLPSPRLHDSIMNSEIDSYSNPSVKNEISFNEYPIEHQLIRSIPRADSSSLSLESDDDNERIRMKPKKNYSRSFVATGILSSSSDNEERKGKRSMQESKPTLIRSKKQHQKDMQLDEFYAQVSTTRRNSFFHHHKKIILKSR